MGIVITNEQWRRMYENAWKYTWDLIDENWQLKDEVKKNSDVIWGLKNELKGGEKMFNIGDFNLDFDCDDETTEFIFEHDGEKIEFSKGSIPAEFYDKEIKSVKIVPERSDAGLKLCCYFELKA